MIERARFLHADLFHDRFRRRIRIGTHGKDFIQSSGFKRELQTGFRSFGCVAFSPGGLFQAPADINTWRERAFVSLMKQPDEADELTAA